MTAKRAENGATGEVRLGPAIVTPALEAAADPFEDLSSIRLGQDFDAELGVKRLPG